MLYLEEEKIKRIRDFINIIYKKIHIDVSPDSYPGSSSNKHNKNDRGGIENS
jgi:hypothetical protein